MFLSSADVKFKFCFFHALDSRLEMSSLRISIKTHSVEQAKAFPQKRVG